MAKYQKWSREGIAFWPVFTVYAGFHTAAANPKGVGRIRARYLTARLPNPPVRPVRTAFTAHGSRDRDIYGHFFTKVVSF
jgi:hypothetical protein